MLGPKFSLVERELLEVLPLLLVLSGLVASVALGALFATEGETAQVDESDGADNGPDDFNETRDLSLFEEPRPEQIQVGTDETETLTGTDADDTIISATSTGSMDTDIVKAGGGDDTIIADAGDSVNPGEGKDEIILHYRPGMEEPLAVSDFHSVEDTLAIQLQQADFPEAELELVVQDWEEGGGFDVLLNNELAISVSGQPGLSPDQIQLNIVSEETTYDSFLREGGQIERVETGLEFSSQSGFSSYFGSDVSDQIIGDGVIQGMDGDDTLIGASAQPNVILGGHGDDFLVSSVRLEDVGSQTTVYAVGSEVGAELHREGSYLSGGSGDDTLWMSSGDTANGGEGSDAFTLFLDTGSQYSEMELRDGAVAVVEDFEIGVDKLSVAVNPINGGAHQLETIEIVEYQNGTEVRMLGTTLVWLPGVSGLTEDDVEFYAPGDMIQSNSYNTISAFTAVAKTQTK